MLSHVYAFGIVASALSLPILTKAKKIPFLSILKEKSVKQPLQPLEANNEMLN